MCRREKGRLYRMVVDVLALSPSLIMSSRWLFAQVDHYRPPIDMALVFTGANCAVFVYAAKHIPMLELQMNEVSIGARGDLQASWCPLSYYESVVHTS